jgi:hypothetical protein
VVAAVGEERDDCHDARTSHLERRASVAGVGRASGSPGKSPIRLNIRVRFENSSLRVARQRSIKVTRIITLEEHFATPGFLDGPGCNLKEQARQVGGRAERLMCDLCDIGEGRIAQMDAAGIDMQVVSLTAPGAEQLEAAEAVIVGDRRIDPDCRKLRLAAWERRFEFTLDRLRPDHNL